MLILRLYDPISNSIVIAEADMQIGGSWKISISGFNFLYSRLKDDPKKFVGFVFIEKPAVQNHGLDKLKVDQNVNYMKVVNAVHEWVPSTKKTELPFLNYNAVKFQTITDQLMAIEALEAYRQFLEGNFVEKTD